MLYIEDYLIREHYHYMAIKDLSKNFNMVNQSIT